ncbi:MAG: hypothetical protein ACOCXA_08820 [Planctomycetota bacterium]
MHGALAERIDIRRNPERRIGILEAGGRHQGIGVSELELAGRIDPKHVVLDAELERVGAETHAGIRGDVEVVHRFLAARHQLHFAAHHHGVGTIAQRQRGGRGAEFASFDAGQAHGEGDPFIRETPQPAQCVASDRSIGPRKIEGLGMVDTERTEEFNLRPVLLAWLLDHVQRLLRAHCTVSGQRNRHRFVPQGLLIRHVDDLHGHVQGLPLPGIADTAEFEDEDRLLIVPLDMGLERRRQPRERQHHRQPEYVAITLHIDHLPFLSDSSGGLGPIT